MIAIISIITVISLITILLATFEHLFELFYYSVIPLKKEYKVDKIDIRKTKTET